MSTINFTLLPNRLSPPQGVDGRYLYITECDAEFELIVGDNPPILLNKHDDIDLQQNAGQQRILRLRDVSGHQQEVIIESSTLPFTKKKSVKVSPDSVISIADGSKVGIDSRFNDVKVIGDVTITNEQYSAIAGLLQNIKEEVQKTSSPQRVLEVNCKVLNGQYTINNAVHFSVFSIDDHDFKVNDQLVPFSVVVNAPEIQGAMYRGVKVEPASGKKLMLMEVK